MPNNDLKTIKEFLEILSNKVGKLENSFRLHISTLYLVRDQQSVMNDKLDNLQSGMKNVEKDLKELNKKTDQVFKYASDADEDLQDTKKRLTRIERVPVIAHELSK